MLPQFGVSTPLTHIRMQRGSTAATHAFLLREARDRDVLSAIA
jgi:hypothetical protein